MAAEQALDPESTAYNVNVAFEISGALDVKKLEGALFQVVARSEALRSYYPSPNGVYVRKAASETDVCLERVRAAKDDVPDLILSRSVPFDIGDAPLVRFCLYETGADEYVLSVCAHHIIIDGAGAEVFFDELWRIYSGETLPLPVLDFSDYSVWSERHGGDIHGEEFFAEMFRDGLPENEMPCRAKRPDILPFADTRVIREIDDASIVRKAREFGVSPFSLVLSAAGIAVAKICGSEDVVLGVPLSGRVPEEVKGMIGMFVNTLPIRLKPDGSLSVSQYVRAVSDLAGGVREHQTYPFEKLVPILAPDRDRSRSPIFDVTVNYLRELPSPRVEGMSVRRLDIRNQAIAMDFVLEITYGEDHLRATLYYSKDLYMDEVAEGFLDLFAVILERITGGGAESRLLCDVAELPPARRAQILESFRGRCTDKDARTVVDMFRERTVLTPGRRAVVFEDRELSYRELDDLTDRLAARLALMREGSAKNVVGVLVRRSEMMPVGALGVLKSGAAYLPLDPSYPASRLSYMLSDAAVSVVIADRDLCGKLPDFGGKFLYADEIHGLPASDAEVVPPSPEDLFILLYTSGTTGNPKGVMLSHANLTNFCLWFRENYKLTEDDNVPAYASFGFDACMMDMYPALTNGACVHIIPERMRLELPELNDCFNENGVTVAFLTTQLGRQFVEMMDNHSLRALTTGGETLVPIEPPDAYTLYNAYGPTECTIFTAIFRVDRLYDRVPIGKPLYNTSLYIVDGRNRLAPVGTSGELCIAGRQVGMGYLNRPDLTREKFVPNPFSDDPEYAVMYRTGDFARFLPDGNIDFTGRSDFQVKIRGFRVELTEIEGRIRLYPGITDATVIATDAPGGGKQVVAYIVADSPVDIEALNQFIEKELPPYMVPSVTMQTDKIPLTPNGKVDRRALPKPEVSVMAEIVAPATELERLVLSMAEELCSVKGIGVTANLLRSGLQSLSSIKLAAQIKARTGLSLSGGDIVRAKTARGIAALLSEAQGVKGGLPESSDEARISPGMSAEAWPLMENQMGIYYECAADPQSILYNVPVSLNLPADTDPERLRDAFLSVIEVHSCLKSRLEERNGDLMFVRSECAADIPILSAADADIADAKKTFVQPFDLFKGPLFRAKIYRTESSVHLLMDFHHIIFDGVSCSIFMEDLADAHQGRMIAPEEVSSFESAAEERALEGGEAWNASSEHFKKLFSSFEEVTTLQPDYPSAGGGGAEVSVGIQIPLGEIGDFCRNIGIMPSSLFLGAASLAISRFVRSRSVLLCAISSGRDDPRSRRSVGMRVRTIPLGVRSTPETTIEGYLSDVQDRFFEAIENQLYPLTKISADYGFKPDIMYAYQNVLGETVRFRDAEVKIELLSHGMPAKNPLTVTVAESPTHFGLSLEYDEALYAELTIKALLESIVQSLNGLMEGELSEKISKIPVICEEGMKKVSGFNSPIQPSSDCNLFSMIEAQAARTPDAEALIAADRTMTYRELNEAANRLAHGLIDRGVERGDRVVLLLPRDSRVIISMLGVMKAGGVYIPVDPTYPPERIRQILEDSDARYLIAPEKAHSEAVTAKETKRLTPDELMDNAPTVNPGVEVGPDDMIYLIYTSGSTGKPKGVMLRHGGLVNYVSNRPANLNADLIAKTKARMVSVTTVSFDAFIDDIYIPLTNGLPVILASEEEAGHPERLAELFERTGGSGLNVTPSRLQQFMASPRLSRALAACRFFDIGAEQFPAALYRDLSALNPDAIILNSYGPTEATVACNGKIVEDARKITAGRPMWNVVESVRDPEGLPLPVGASGELWIGGEGVALGYVNNPELTGERFVEENGVRYYKSGDLAKWTEDGEIVVLGRIDEQVKLRGLRIELGEVENTVLTIAGVHNAAVRIRKIRGQEHLCAWFTADREISPAVMREEMSKTLPQYMLPTAFLQLEKLPSTISGKVDAKSLPDPELAGSAAYVRPETKQEEDFARIFERTLDLTRVGALDNFFDIGGSSLLVTRVIVEAQSAGYALNYGDVFANPTPRALAAVSVASPSAQAEAPVVKIPSAPRSDDRTGEPARRGTLADYDYTSINRLLAGNVTVSLRRGSYRPLGDIALTGATGFLGIHVLREFLASERGTVRCLVRGGALNAERRLKELLVYYFSDDFEDLFGKRIFVAEGDATDPASWEALFAAPVDTLFNCAANVKHFAVGDEIDRVNIGVPEQGVRMCLSHRARLIHVSTTSVAGMSTAGLAPEESELTEQRLYFGQRLEGQKYLNSKFLAERMVLSSIAEQGLDAKIMRVGNLMARQEDGEFQINFNTNSFIRLLRAYRRLGLIPWDEQVAPSELSPIDLTARAILKLAKTPRECCVFHPYDDHGVLTGDVIDALNRRGLGIRPCETEEFAAALAEGLKDPEMSRDLGVLIAYSGEGGENTVMLRSSNAYTSQALRRMGFIWPLVEEGYLDSFVEGLSSLGFFD